MTDRLENLPDEAIPGPTITIHVQAPLPHQHQPGGLPIVVRFGLQIITGTVVFGLIAGAAALLSYSIRVMEGLGVSKIILTGLRGVEFLLFAADILCVTIFVVVETITLIRSMVAGLRRER